MGRSLGGGWGVGEESGAEPGGRAEAGGGAEAGGRGRAWPGRRCTRGQPEATPAPVPSGAGLGQDSPKAGPAS